MNTVIYRSCSLPPGISGRWPDSSFDARGQAGTIPLGAYAVGQAFVATLVVGSRMYLSSSYGVVHFVIPGVGEIEDRLHDHEQHHIFGTIMETAFLSAPLFLLVGWWLSRLLFFRGTGNSQASEARVDNP